MLLKCIDSVEVEIIENEKFDFLMNTSNVAKGYGTSQVNIRNAKRNNQNELIEGKHYLTDKTNGKKMLWTKNGIVRLGFFIKSERAKKFRDWAEDYIVNQKQSVETTIQIELSKLNQEIKDLKKQLALKKQEDENPFKGFYTPNWAFRKRENEWAYTRKDWMLLLNECERTLTYERENRKYRQQLLLK
ncbi:hypothetical protein [Aliarcobacter cryaerophilus]|uniref:hypothetical protein n=1 Tax=Aliarcobacter cryaerophilus TaxID=28198 RepID=UPI003BB1B177